MSEELMEHDRVFRGVLFDMDGVIIDSAAEVELFWEPRLKDKGIELSEREFLMKLHGRPAREIVQDFFADESEQRRKALLEECEKFDREHEIRLVPGVRDLLRALRKHRIPTGLVTSALRSKVQNTFDSLKTDGHFSVLVTSEDVQDGKPHPECYRKAARGLGLQAEECIVFEDSVNGIRAGCQAGALVVGINKPDFKSLLKEQGAHTVMADFRTTRLNRAEPDGFTLSADGGFVAAIAADRRR